MKTFRNDKVYVQVNDLMFAKGFDDNVPSSVTNKIYTIGCATSHSKRIKMANKFVSFNDSNAINYFVNSAFIIDYDKYENYTIKQLQEKIDELIAKVDEINKKKHSIHLRNSSKYAVLFDGITVDTIKCEYVINCLYDLIQIKIGAKQVNIPKIETNEQPKFAFGFVKQLLKRQF